MTVGIVSAADTSHGSILPAPTESTEETLLIFWCIRPATSDEYASPAFPNRSAINWSIEVLSSGSFETVFGAKGRRQLPVCGDQSCRMQRRYDDGTSLSSAARG